MKPAIEHLRESGAMLEGHFLLSSGRHSDRYFQCALLLREPWRAAETLSPVAEAIRNSGLAPNLLVGPAMGGIIPAWELGRLLGLPALFTERDEAGAMRLRRGFTIPDGARVLIVEDVVTTGKSSGECAAALADALAAAGGRVVGLAAIVDRREAGQELAWPIFGAARMPAESWLPGDCPLCARGLPFVKPGSRKAV